MVALRPPTPRYDLVSSEAASRFRVVLYLRNLQLTKSSSRSTDPSVWGYSQKEEIKVEYQNRKNDPGCDV
jgi:hypothetical protein